MSILLRVLLFFVAVASAVYILPGIRVSGDTMIQLVIVIKFSLVLGVLSVTLKPVLKLLALPLTLHTLGLFSVMINLAVIYLASYLVHGLTITSLLQALLFSIWVGVITAIGSILID